MTHVFGLVWFFLVFCFLGVFFSSGGKIQVIRILVLETLQTDLN